MKGDPKPDVGPEMYRQTKPCGDCPFRKDGGARHGVVRVFQYASYFTHEPSITFPCHETRREGQDNDAWTGWTEGQTICAGGLIFAEKVHQQNRLLQHAQQQGWYDPAALRDTESICKDWVELADVQSAALLKLLKNEQEP